MFVKITSHRSRDRLESVLGYVPCAYFSFRKDGEWYEIPDEQSQKVLRIKGIVKSKLPKGAMKCWEGVP